MTASHGHEVCRPEIKVGKLRRRSLDAACEKEVREGLAKQAKIMSIHYSVSLVLADRWVFVVTYCNNTAPYLFYTRQDEQWKETGPTTGARLLFVVRREPFESFACALFKPGLRSILSLGLPLL